MGDSPDAEARRLLLMPLSHVSLLLCMSVLPVELEQRLLWEVVMLVVVMMMMMIMSWQRCCRRVIWLSSASLLKDSLR